MDRAARTYLGVRSAALVTGDRAPAAELVGGSPELAKRALQSSVWIEVWPWSTRKACANHLDNQGRGLGLGTSCAAAGRCWAMASLAGDGVLTSDAGYRLIQLA